MTKRLLHAGWSWAVLAVLAAPAIADSSSAPEPVAPARLTPFVQVLRRACESTVNIHTEKRSKSIDVVFGPTKGQGKVNGMGTGIVIDERGYILTNNHVVQEVESIRVTLNTGASYVGEVFQTDAANDLAILRIRSKDPLKVIPLGTSSDLMLGEDVIAIGNAYGYEHTVTRGIVSALNRDVEASEGQAYEGLIQTDAAINPGNSGGPLLNSLGEVIGINVAIRAGAAKIGFAIPIDDARKVAARMLSVERIDNHFHGAVVKDEKAGALRRLLVQAVKPNSPASEAGLKAGDVVLRVDSTTVIDGADFERALLDRKTSDLLPVLVNRNGKEEALSLKLTALRPEAGSSARQQAALPTQAPNAQLVAGARLDRGWTVLGVKAVPVPQGDARLVTEKQRYQGGMQITDVRPGSPAAQSGIQKDDILVGMHVWETVKSEDISYVLNHRDLAKFNPVRFYVVRSRDTLYGELKLELK